MQARNAAFLKHYETYKDKIYAYFWYRVGFDKTQAEDLTSEVFIKAIKNYDSYDESRPFQAWIYAIAKNHLINHYAKMGREVALESIAEPTEDFCEQFEIKMEWEEVVAKMNDMKDYHREVLLLRFVDGMSNEEIAKHLDKDERAVRTQISRALKELKECV